MDGNQYTRALVRPPGMNCVNAIAEVPQVIDPILARWQHREYVQALKQAGVHVEKLPVSEDYPDSCFMQDPAMVVGGVAILNRMGAASRVGETALVADVLRARFETFEIEAPGTIEGGDVLNVGDRLFVGITERTNAAGIEQLRAFVAPRGLAVESIAVRDYLHLLCVVTYVGQGTVVVMEDFADHPMLKAFKQILVPKQEMYAANTLGIGNYVIVPAGFPKTAELLKAEGFEVLAVPMSEFYKADGGVSCLSLIW